MSSTVESYSEVAEDCISLIFEVIFTVNYSLSRAIGDVEVYERCLLPVSHCLFHHEFLHKSLRLFIKKDC